VRIETGSGKREGGARAAVEAVRAAARLMAARDADALVTAPVSKRALRLGGYLRHRGQGHGPGWQHEGGHARRRARASGRRRRPLII
jgi:hypothetical protein